MNWTTKRKNIHTSSSVPHVKSAAGVVGRAPANLAVNFSPHDLFAAAARCSHLHLVNPSISTPEFQMIAKLIEPHVDNSSSNFAVLASVDSFKDFIKSYFVGTVATGLAYLAMINEGYVWSDHFEHLGGGNPSHTKKPDFVFAGVATGVALVEAKGGRSGSLNKFNTVVSDGYTDQVEAHLGHAVGGVTASHGYCIGAWLQSAQKADLLVHYTEVPAPPQPPRDDATADISTIQQHNFATAFALTHGPRLGNALRTGDSRYLFYPFWRFTWLGVNWVTGFGLNWSEAGFNKTWLLWDDLYLGAWELSPNQRFFAIEESRAKAALSRFLGKGRFLHADLPGMTPIDSSLQALVREQEDGQGTVFPDGLAYVDLSRIKVKFEPVVWNVDRLGFE